MERNQMIFFRSYYEAGKCIESVKERLKFYEAIFELALNGIEIQLKGTANAIFLGIKPNINQSRKRAESRAAKNDKTPDISAFDEIDDRTDGMTGGMSIGQNKIETEDSTIAELPSIGRGIGEGKGKEKEIGHGSGEGEGEGGTSAVRRDAEARTRPKQTGFVPPTLDEVRAYCAERGNTVNPERFVDYYTVRGWMVGNQRMCSWQAAVRSWETNEITDKGAGKWEEKRSTGSFCSPVGQSSTGHADVSDNLFEKMFEEQWSMRQSRAAEEKNSKKSEKTLDKAEEMC